MDERITRHSLYLALDEDAEHRQAAYCELFRSELDDDELTDIRIALSQGQSLGSERFSEIVCAAVGMRRAQKKPGRPMKRSDLGVSAEGQDEFGF